MAAQANLTDKSATGTNALDKSGWTERQHLEYIVGVWDGVDGHPVRPRELPPSNWLPNDDWRKLEGSLSDHPEHDTSEMKARERAFEEEHDARKFGIPAYGSVDPGR